ncbi:ATP-binding cassette domain-containing protein [Paracoccus liaowanqingii]|uniref:ATP-binding cassette domain-containing protein n=1 Tax=Paracoccus liaowanqingii TaxID=2560053 RepID=A0A4Z1CRM1_9RHOB|nr:oligopeptide/dipeptide ABC transporter ATP-binding protein [Paracoccus liaowanqingii]TGN67756.1 ATP-binding cassette domain-containing protein [Paracoccus liaowanqingii]
MTRALERSRTPILTVENVVREYGRVAAGWMRPARSGMRAVDGVTLQIDQGETVAVVGESGCGKSTLLRCIVSVDDVSDGHVRFEGVDVRTMPKAERSNYRRHVQMIFQDPTASLNPRKRVSDIIGEPYRIHFGKALSDERVCDLMSMVGLDPDRRDAYPSQFSGGQRQRIAIARALAVEPRVMLFDEPVAALDVSVQAQILNLLCEIRDRTGVASVFVSHDLSVVRFIAQKVFVMYLGRVVESGPVAAVFDNPSHPYTQALISAVPKGLEQVDLNAPRITLQGEPPDPARPPQGCRFNPRCWKATSLCRSHVPLPTPRQDGHGTVACHHQES